MADAAQTNPFRAVRVPRQLFTLTMSVGLLAISHEHITALEKQIGALAAEIPECRWVQTIPGIGKKLAATIATEIGEINRCSHPNNSWRLRGSILACLPPVHIQPRSIAFGGAWK